MRLITVHPVSKGIRKNTLTYFTKENIANGSIVKIPLKSQMIHGLVTDSRDVAEAKSEIKSLSYSMRRIEKVSSTNFLLDDFIASAKDIADYYATSLGSVLATFIPKVILENADNLSFTPKTKSSKEKNKDTASEISSETHTTYFETLLLQAETEERFATYKSLIREEFARGHSVLFILPTTEHIYNAEETLYKGIDDYTYSLHSGLSKKESNSRWKKIMEESHPVLVIATAPFVSLPRQDFGTIIVEKENSRAYTTQSRPYIDLRLAVKLIAKRKNIKLVLGDSFLRVETIWEGKQGNSYSAQEVSMLKFRSLSQASCEVIDMTQQRTSGKTEDRKEFSIWSTELWNLLHQSRDTNERTVLFCGRKGLFPTTVCSDCGTLVVCTNCAAPVVLYTKMVSKGSKGTLADTYKNLYVCHHCGERREADVLCHHCGGWRLTPLGIGIDRIEKEIRELFPDRICVVMDSEHIRTHKQAVDARNTFYNSPGSILLGTEMCLPYLNQQVENSSVVSMDSFFSIPDFRIHEKIFTILLSLRNITERKMLVQTREPKRKIFEYALKGNLADFYREEIEERKQINYPPFCTYIKLSLTGDKRSVRKEMEEIQKKLSPTPLALFDAWNPGKESSHTLHGLITLPRDHEHDVWPEATLLSKLRELPPECVIKIDPDTLL